ncbi:hypothetical protein [Paenibacillus sp. MAEPY2]|uniref:hypothetical protein n=1 Tax=Paenibacillus sp. MAEPY2 TaxID=1395587 RepID=UPI0004001DB1|nr:hypothetical protein [Paenibacillus sp. MAEPY2]KGP85295.1 hypothetical protein P364_0101370 [Paenibacillus sp. MAEPY2]
MKRWMLVVPFLLFLVPGVAFALDIQLNNYYYAHTNEAGTRLLGDKFSNTTLRADASNSNGVLVNLRFRSLEGLGSDKLYIKYSDGTKQQVTDTYVQLDKRVPSVQIELQKTTTKETLIEVSSVVVSDADSAELINYTYNGSTPTKYGDLGNGSGGTDPGNVTKIPLNSYYVSYRDEYRADYTAPAGISKYQLYFTSDSGTVHTLDYSFKPTGIHYLTCNGTYRINFFDSSGKLVSQTEDARTTAIQNPACKSYTEDEASGRDDLSARKDGSDIKWNNPPSGTKEVQIWKDGQKIATNSAEDTTHKNAGPGSYSVVAVGTDGKPIGQSDLNVTDGTGPDPSEPGTNPSNPGTDCGTCEKLDQMLACPGWELVMNDLTDAIKAALPPPPDWDDIADKIGRATVRHLSDYLGDVPAPPSKEQIKQDTETPLPQLDTTTGVENLTPKVPEEYNSGDIKFDLERDAPVIEVKDESKPFDIAEPLNNIEYDDPGKAVLPGDSNNNSGGIKEPDKVDTGDQEPKPKQIIFDLPRPGPTPNPTPSNPPLPSPTPSNPPIPGGTGGGPAIPDPSTGTIPIPNVGG